jgi:predicted hotdog family 3-hydroxylacyl-ACP dehydratase
MNTAYLPIETYVPHRGAMRLLDALIEADTHHAVAQLTIPLDGLFVEHGQVPAWVGLEYMAQTIAAWSGHRNLATRTPRSGLLLGTRHFDAQVPAFAAGSVLRVVAHHQFSGDNGMDLFQCEIWQADTLVASASVSTLEAP